MVTDLIRHGMFSKVNKINLIQHLGTICLSSTQFLHLQSFQKMWVDPFDDLYGFDFEPGSDLSEPEYSDKLECRL